jgi:hypothetical protein
MGRTIPSFRIAAILEEKEWKSSRKYLNKKNDKKAFDDMFSISRLYNSACSYAANSIRIHPIMMSIVLHHYKILKEKKLTSTIILLSMMLIWIIRPIVIVIIMPILIIMKYNSKNRNRQRE